MSRFVSGRRLTRIRTGAPRAMAVPRVVALPRLLTVLGLLGVSGLSGCTSIQETALPQPVSPPPTAPPPAPVPGGLRAGFGTRDITPPPGVGMSAFSADSRQAVGFRQRLYARAIVLEDESGERVALVVVDLGMVSLVLHRRVADRTLRSGTEIGADRLLLSATHTHSGPGNFFAADGYNANAGRFVGLRPRGHGPLDRRDRRCGRGCRFGSATRPSGLAFRAGLGLHVQPEL